MLSIVSISFFLLFPEYQKQNKTKTKQTPKDFFL